MSVSRLAVVILGSLLGAAAVIACTSFSGDDPPADAPDAGDAAESAPAADASDEDAADARVAPFCVVHAGSPHCTDFDRENPVSYGYESVVGVVTRDQEKSISPPAAARFEQKGGEAYLRRKLSDEPGFASTQRLSFELTPPGLDGTAKAYDVIVASVEQGGSEA